MALRVHDAQDQLDELERSVKDPRPAIPTGFDGIDVLLRRGGILPGNFVLLGGRTGTRKTTVALNMVVAMLKADVPVGFVGLDEAEWLYVSKLISIYAEKPQEWAEEHWDDDEGQEARRAWKELAVGKLVFLHGRRPRPESFDSALKLAAGRGTVPRILFVDYLALASREGEYGYSEAARLPRLAEDIQVWSNESGVAVVALHQLSRNDEFGGSNSRNAGHIPVTLAQLKYGGEEMADLVLGTYRTSMNPLGNMEMSVAREVLGDRFDEEEYLHARAAVQKQQHVTRLQLLKNRPGVHREERGVKLISPDASLRMYEEVAEREHEGAGVGSGAV